jgi:hypothetical protein
METDKEDGLSLLFGWAIWGHLDRYKEYELILLKGHLLLDVCLSDGDVKADIGFYSKILRHENRTGDQVIGDLLKGLNSMRNSVAHEFIQTDLESNLAKWADEVLSHYDVTFYTRKTRRTRVVHAFVAIGMTVMESRQVKKTSC